MAGCTAPRRRVLGGSMAKRWRRIGGSIAIGLSASLMPIMVGVATAQPAAAAAPKALINGDTVSGSPSLEQQQAEALGFSVDVVTGTQWDAMTQPQFAAYQVLIIGDPSCGSVAPSATS